MGKRVSQADIAAASGVSQSAISAILNGSAGIVVSEATRKRVLESARRLGYRKTSSRAKHAKADTKTIAWIVAYNSRDWENLPAIRAAGASLEQGLLNSVVSALGEYNYSLIVKHHTEGDRLIEWLQQKPVRGVLWRGKRQDVSLFSWIASELPVVAINRFLAPGLDRVLINQEENVTIPLAHLLAAGHRRIAYFGHPPQDYELLSARLQVYQRWMQEHGLRVYSEFFNISDAPEVASSPKVKEILDCWEKLGGDRPTAILLSDAMALNLLHEAPRRGIQIPQELSVIGIDNMTYGEMSQPPLTSMDQPFDEIGRSAVELLMSRIEDPARLGRMVIVSPKLIERKSVHDLNA